MLFTVLMRATVLVIAGYFVLFASSKAEERIKVFGKYLAMWTFVFAVLFVVGSLTAPSFGGRPFGIPMGGGGMGHRPMMQGRMGWMHHHGGGGGGFQGHFMHRHFPGQQPGQNQAPTGSTQQAPANGSSN